MEIAVLYPVYKRPIMRHNHYVLGGRGIVYYKVVVAVSEYSTRLALKSFLELNNFSVVEAPNSASAAGSFKKQGLPDAIILDLKLSGSVNLGAFRKIRAVSEDTPVILLANHNETDLAIEALNAGAYDYFPKPPDIERLLFVLSRCIEARGHLKRMKHTVNSTLKWHIGSGEAMKKTIRDIEAAVNSTVAVNIYGEDGTGKSSIARIIHQYGSRAHGPFVQIDTGSEFKGNRGAPAKIAGMFRQASGGTIYFKDLHIISPGVQAALISAITKMAVTESGPAVRIIASSAENLGNHPLTINGTDKGQTYGGGGEPFLFIDWFAIGVPPLASRIEDIPFLAGKFMAEIADEMNIGVRDITKRALKLLLGYRWPGNVRELKNAIRRAVIISNGVLLRAEHFSFLKTGKTPLPEMSLPAEIARVIKDTELKAIMRALDLNSGHKTLAASMLGISRKTLWAKLKEYDIPDIGPKQ
jgi:DNA-binding NtrC family response regulator